MHLQIRLEEEGFLLVWLDTALHIICFHIIDVYTFKLSASIH